MAQRRQGLLMIAQRTALYAKPLAYGTQSQVWRTQQQALVAQELVLNVKTFVFIMKCDLRDANQYLHGMRLLLRYQNLDFQCAERYQLYRSFYLR